MTISGQCFGVSAQRSLFTDATEAASCESDAPRKRLRLAGRKDRAGGPNLPPKIHGWLIRTTRIHAHLTYIVRSFAQARGRLAGDSVEARASRHDRTLLHDCWTYGVTELELLRAELHAEMEPGPVGYRPGSPEKVAELEQRAERLQNLFTDADARL